MRTRAAVVAVVMSGCSLLADPTPPKYPWKEEPECSDYYVPPVIDTLVAAGALALTFYVLDNRGSDDEGTWIYPTLAVNTLGLLAGISSSRGWTGVARCQEAQEQYAKERAAPPLPPPGPPPPQPPPSPAVPPARPDFSE